MTAPPSEISSVPAPAPLAGPHGVRPGARRRETPEAVRPGDHDRPESAAPDGCVIVPTRNERGNVAPLIDRLGRALAGHDAEILFVDDMPTRRSTGTTVKDRVICTRNAPEMHRDGTFIQQVKADGQTLVLAPGSSSHPFVSTAGWSPCRWERWRLVSPCSITESQRR